MQSTMTIGGEDGQDEPDTRDGAQARLAGEVVAACHSINSALTAVLLSVQFLADRTDGDGKGAAEDAIHGLRRIDEVMSRLRELCRSQSAEENRSGVFSCTPARASRCDEDEGR